MKTQTLLSRILFLCLVLGLTACGESDSDTASQANKLVQEPREDRQKDIVNEAVFPEGPSGEMYARLAPKADSFSIQTDKVQALELRTGARLIVPAGAFVDAQGNVPTSVDLEVYTASKPSDFVRMGLTSTSPKGFLSSDGMFHISAKSKGENVQVRAGSSLYLSDKWRMMDGQTYYGTRKDGGMEWNYGDEFEGEMIPIPAADLYPSPFILYYGYGIPDTFDYTPYKGTWILTTEFRERTEDLTDLISYIDAYTERNSRGGKNLNTDLTKIYFDNTHLPLYKADLKVCAYLDSLFVVHAGGPYEPSMQYFARVFRNYALKKQTHVIRFDNVEVDWDAPDAAQQLVDKHGLNEATAARYVALHKEIPAIREALKKERDFKIEHDGRRIRHFIPITTVIGSTGWANIDKLLAAPWSEKMDPTVSIENAEAYEVVDLTLTFPEYGVTIPAYRGQDGLWHFTRPQSGMDELPSKDRGYFVAIGLRDGKTCYGKAEMRGAPDGVVEIALEPMSELEIEYELSRNLKR
ncbi:MAG: hypothetical protein AAF570_06745 [Bacteroidota bacterium]